MGVNQICRNAYVESRFGTISDVLWCFGCARPLGASGVLRNRLKGVALDRRPRGPRWGRALWAEMGEGPRGPKRVWPRCPK